MGEVKFAQVQQSPVQGQGQGQGRRQAVGMPLLLVAAPAFSGGEGGLARHCAGEVVAVFDLVERVVTQGGRRSGRGWSGDHVGSGDDEGVETGIGCFS